MTKETPESFVGLSDFYTALFEALPSGNLLLQANPPHYTILAVTPLHLTFSGLQKEDVIGKELFEVFPSNPEDANDTGESNLKASLDYVIQKKEPHQLPVQRYDVVDDYGRFVERYWKVENKPVLAIDGAVAYIIHTTEDVTDRVRAEAHLELQNAYRKIEESEAKFRSLVEKAPVATCLFVGGEMVIEVANEAMIQVWGKGSNVIGKPLAEALPELKGQHFLPLLDDLFATGSSYSSKGGQADLVVDGQLQTFYFDYDFKPLRTTNGTVYAILETAIDVTAPVLAKKALEESERNLRNTILQAPVAMCIFRGPQFVIETANEKMFEFWGKSPEQVIGKPLFEAIPEATNQGYEELMMGVLNTGETFSASELPVKLPRNGVVQTVFINFTYQPLQENDGSISGIMAVAIDVTEQVVTRKKIEESEQYARSLFYNSPVAVLVYVGPDMVLREANEKMLAIFGRGEEIIGKPIMEAIPELAASPLMGYYQEVLATGITHHDYAEHILLIKDGQPYWGYYDYTYKALHDTAGAIYGVICTAVDVTQQVEAQRKVEESEERFRHLADDSPMFVFIIDPDALAPVSYWNKTWLDYTGQTLEEAMGRAWDGIIHPDDMAVVMEHYSPAFENKESYLIPAVRVKRHDGVYRWHTFKGNPRYLPNGEFNGYIGVGFDVHEQKITEEGLEGLVAQRTEALQQTNKELQRSNQNLEEFAHAASHDLKEPIRKIHFFTHQLREQLSDRLKENEKFSFGRIENATERMGNLIDDLLLYSHVSQRPHETEAIDLNVKVQRVLEDLELDIKEKGAIINVGELPVIQGYRRQLQQLFQNLISNAVKYSKANVPPYIHIRAEKAREDNRSYHVISVQDNGIGFDQQYEDKIFQMFARLHGKSEYNGTGVGLSIVKKVVENHKGFIRVKSEPGTGSTFKIYLPV